MGWHDYLDGDLESVCMVMVASTTSVQILGCMCGCCEGWDQLFSPKYRHIIQKAKAKQHSWRMRYVLIIGLWLCNGVYREKKMTWLGERYTYMISNIIYAILPTTTNRHRHMGEQEDHYIQRKRKMSARYVDG